MAKGTGWIISLCLSNHLNIFDMKKNKGMCEELNEKNSTNFVIFLVCHQHLLMLTKSIPCNQVACIYHTIITLLSYNKCLVKCI